MKASAFDTGENWGNRALVAVPATSAVVQKPQLCVAVQISHVEPVSCSKASVMASCDHVGLSLAVPLSTSVRCDEPSDCTSTSDDPDATAMRVPSGDQTGPVTS